MAFNDLQQKVISEYAVYAAHRNLAPIKLFSHTFTDLDGRPGESVGVAVYDLSASAEFNPESNNYGTGVNEIGGMLINLDQHLVKSVAITDKQIAFTGIDWVRNTSSALAENLSRGVNKAVFNLVNSTNCPLSASFDASSKQTIANLYSIAEENDIPADKSVVVLSPSQFAKVLGLVDYSMVGSGDYVKTGVIDGGLFGFKAFVCSSNLPENAKGAIMLSESIGVVSKYLAPATVDAYPEAFAIKDESGFTFGLRRFMNLDKGTDMFAMDVLFGCKCLQPNKIVRLV